jgi:CDP-diacylglycerol--glycerol-3-phosphate 3-phosphatidyltransferase
MVKSDNMADTFSREDSILRVLRLRWLSLSILAGIFLVGVFYMLSQVWLPEMVWRWLLLASFPAAYLLAIMWQGLALNTRIGDSTLLPDLGPGNGLTFVRGMLTAALAGFLFLPLPPGWISWLPGLLYTTAALADLFDGYLARRSNHVTRLGERLDMSLDGLGILIGAVLLVQYGKVPVFYILVGMARYLFVAGIWLRTRLGKQVYDLKPSTLRRPFAGAQMGFIGVVLFPIFNSPGTNLVATCFMLPFLVGFFIDWLTVSGVIRDRGKLTITGPAGIIQFLTTWGVLILRFVVALTLFWFLARLLDSFTGLDFLSPSIIAIYIFGLLGGMLLILGAAGRIAALAVLFSFNLIQQFNSLGAFEIFVIVGATAVFFVGSGTFSLWVPEKRLISKRLGEV